jgi:hypothetical protein
MKFFPNFQMISQLPARPTPRNWTSDTTKAALNASGTFDCGMRNAECGLTGLICLMQRAFPPLTIHLSPFTFRLSLRGTDRRAALGEAFVRAGLALFLLLALPGCATVQSLPNDCLIDAVVYQHALEADQRLDKVTWSRILAVKFTDQAMGHALVAFDHRGNLWTWDEERGSRPLSYNDRNAAKIAWQVYGSRVGLAWFLPEESK